MGLKNNDSNITYLRLREGKFYVGKDKEKGWGALEGRIVSMRFKDEEYEGTPQRKLIVVMNDGETNYQIGLNVESQNYSTFVSFLKGADINEVLTLHPKEEVITKDGKDIKKQSILVSQNGVYCKGYFTKDNRRGAPEWKTITVGKKKVTDKSDYTAFMENFVTENYINQLQQFIPETKAKAEVVENEAEAVLEGEENAKLPWDD
jgi:hypothetical protein